MFCFFEWVLVSIPLSLSLSLSFSLGFHLLYFFISGSIFGLPIWLFVQCITFWNFLICAKNELQTKKKNKKKAKCINWFCVISINHFRLGMEFKGWIFAYVGLYILFFFVHNFFVICKTVSIRSHISSRRMAEWGYLSHYFIGFDHCRHQPNEPHFYT